MLTPDELDRYEAVARVAQRIVLQADLRAEAQDFIATFDPPTVLALSRLKPSGSNSGCFHWSSS